MDELTLKAEAEKLLAGAGVLQDRDREIASLKAQVQALTRERDDLNAEHEHVELVARSEGWDPDQTNATAAQWLVHRVSGVVAPLKEERDRVVLWAHLVSMHSAVLDLDSALSELRDLHEHEHDGPGTIRNHPRIDRSFSLKKLGEVLSEAED